MGLTMTGQFRRLKTTSAHETQPSQKPPEETCSPCDIMSEILARGPHSHTPSSTKRYEMAIWKLVSGWVTLVPRYKQMGSV